MTEQRESPRRFIPYEIPLEADAPRSDCARLVLPEDMTTEEAERICRVIRSLAFDAAPSTPERESER